MKHLHEVITVFVTYSTWTSQPCLPVCCPTSPEQRLQICLRPDPGHWQQVRWCADQEAAAAATWLYLHTSHQSQLGSWFFFSLFRHQSSLLKVLASAFSLIRSRNVPVQQKPAWKAKIHVFCCGQTWQPQLLYKVIITDLAAAFNLWLKVA